MCSENREQFRRHRMLMSFLEPNWFDDRHAAVAFGIEAADVAAESIDGSVDDIAVGIAAIRMLGLIIVVVAGAA